MKQQNYSLPSPLGEATGRRAKRGNEGPGVRLYTFTDPMMGLSYECEPIFRKLETHFAGQIEFRYAMGLLVRDVRDFMIPSDYASTTEQSIRNYNARLAKIYESEESISSMPINMDGFCLFSEEHTSSLPLNLAYKAAQLAAPTLADRFLYNLRYATIVDTRPTTHLEEILKVVRQTGIDEQSLTAIRQLLNEHPLISPIELREAFDFTTTDDVCRFIQPLIDNGEVTIRNVKRGYFFVKC